MDNKYGISALSKEVSDNFDFPNWVGGHRQNFGTFGVVDLSTLTLAQAERLDRLNFPKIKRKVAKKETLSAKTK